LATLLGKKKINQEAHMADDKPKDGEITKLSGEDNIIHPTTLDQLPEYLRKDVDAKNTANVAATLAACSSKTRSSKLAARQANQSTSLYLRRNIYHIN
jgi:hypothetical protein